MMDDFVATCWGQGNRKSNILYFIQAENGLIKIGVCFDAALRFSQLSRISPIKLTLLGSIPGNLSKEKEIHTKFKNLNSHGEWFRPDKELLGFIKEALNGN